MMGCPVLLRPIIIKEYYASIKCPDIRDRCLKRWLVQRNHTHFTSKISLPKKIEYISLRLNYAHGAEINRLVMVISDSGCSTYMACYWII